MLLLGLNTIGLLGSGGGRLSWLFIFGFLHRELSIWSYDILRISWCGNSILYFFDRCFVPCCCCPLWVRAKCGACGVPGSDLSYRSEGLQRDRDGLEERLKEADRENLGTMGLHQEAESLRNECALGVGIYLLM